MSKPNILIIMSDEHAPMYSSVYGHPYRSDAPHGAAGDSGGDLRRRLLQFAAVHALAHVLHDRSPRA